MKLLIIEDEMALQESIRDYLTKEGYVCETASDYHMAEEKVHLYRYDVVLLDLTLPFGNGIEILKALRKEQPETGTIIISAKDALDDKLTALDLGADDYMTKPFHLSELNSRIRAVIRRRRFDGTEKIIFNEITIDTNSREIQINDRIISLTRKEYEMLLHFIINKNRVFTKESIAEHLWGDHIDMSENFDFIYTHLNNLRKKLKQAGCRDYIRTMYGIGYKFEALEAIK
ncbi:response regulator transcription factor [candidate division KSB1 bacterium]